MCPAELQHLFLVEKLSVYLFGKCQNFSLFKKIAEKHSLIVYRYPSCEDNKKFVDNLQCNISTRIVS